MNQNQIIEEQLKIIRKGIHSISTEEDLKAKLEKAGESKKPLVIKFGLDPTAPDIHLGHTVGLRKLRQLQELGHQVMIVIGDFTARIGDPTGKTKGRPPLSEKEVLANADTYREQLERILDPDKTVFCFNSEWLSSMNTETMMGYLSAFTVARILERDNFSKRMEEGVGIGMNELMYPALQAIDSVILEADVELGGTDQTFNILAGRHLQGKLGLERQVALLVPILVGTDGVEKMSKSLNNYIGIWEEPSVMYEKVMTIPDEQIIPYFEQVTDVSPERIEDYRHQIKSGQTNPKNIKMCLAREIVTLYWGKEASKEAEQRFITVFSKKQRPLEIPEKRIGDTCELEGFLVAHDLVKSKSEVRRLVAQKGIRINDELVATSTIELHQKDVIRIGKRRYVSCV